MFMSVLHMVCGTTLAKEEFWACTLIDGLAGGFKVQPSHLPDGMPARACLRC
jgi:hypothetical protein